VADPTLPDAEHCPSCGPQATEWACYGCGAPHEGPLYDRRGAALAEAQAKAATLREQRDWARQENDDLRAALAEVQDDRARLLAALAELVALKDGPRDDRYLARKDWAWEQARRAVAAAPAPTERWHTCTPNEIDPDCTWCGPGRGVEQCTAVHDGRFWAPQPCRMPKGHDADYHCDRYGRTWGAVAPAPTGSEVRR
jgi:hypothetical protein